MSRTLVRTGSAGWYVDAEKPEAGKIRKRDGDNVYDTMAEAVAAMAVLASVNSGNSVSTPNRSNGAKPIPAPEESVVVVAPTGKLLVGKTITIKCKWRVDGRACGIERLIKPQDKFQVRYCVEHQKEHRKQIRNKRNRARTRARKLEQKGAVGKT